MHDLSFDQCLGSSPKGRHRRGVTISAHMCVFVYHAR